MSIVPTSAVCCEVALLTSVLLMGTSLNWVVARVTAQRARRAREVTGMAPWTARARGSSRSRLDPSAGIRAAARSHRAHATARLTGAVIRDNIAFDGSGSSRRSEERRVGKE